MTLSELKTTLNQLETLSFRLPDGRLVPAHFHVTEVGRVEKRFIDCGGTLRRTQTVGLQLWSANDYDHRLHPGKLVDIVGLAEKQLELGDWPVEVEFQGATIQTFGLAFDGREFQLLAKQTDCLAKSECGIPAFELTAKQPAILLADDGSDNRCTPGGGCC